MFPKAENATSSRVRAHTAAPAERDNVSPIAPSHQHVESPDHVRHAHFTRLAERGPNAHKKTKPRRRRRHKRMCPKRAEGSTIEALCGPVGEHAPTTATTHATWVNHTCRGKQTRHTSRTSGKTKSRANTQGHARPPTAQHKTHPPPSNGRRHHTFFEGTCARR